MKKNKGIAQGISKTTILYPKTSKEFCHLIKLLKSIMGGGIPYKKLHLKFSNIIRKVTVSESLFNNVY